MGLMALTQVLGTCKVNTGGTQLQARKHRNPISKNCNKGRGWRDSSVAKNQDCFSGRTWVWFTAPTYITAHDHL